MRGHYYRSCAACGYALRHLEGQRVYNNPKMKFVGCELKSDYLQWHGAISIVRLQDPVRSGSIPIMRNPER